MIKRIKTNKKIILLIIFVLFSMGYYIYYSNKSYEEFETASNTEEILVTEEEKEREVTNKKEYESKEIIVVHITGEINNPGVIELEKGARIIDAVRESGGFTENADTLKINLAYILTDGVKIYIPNKDENQEGEANLQKYITEESGDNVIMEESEMKETNNSIVNINKATQAEFETLPGIGPSIASKIITYRNEKGNFNNIEEIKNVSGIGDSKFEKIKEFISI